MDQFAVLGCAVPEVKRKMQKLRGKASESLSNLGCILIGRVGKSSKSSKASKASSEASNVLRTKPWCYSELNLAVALLNAVMLAKAWQSSQAKST